jgi:hypothetical protein
MYKLCLFFRFQFVPQDHLAACLFRGTCPVRAYSTLNSLSLCCIALNWSIVDIVRRDLLYVGDYKSELDYTLGALFGNLCLVTRSSIGDLDSELQTSGEESKTICFAYRVLLCL